MSRGVGLEIQRDQFDEADFHRFDERLRDSVAALEAVLARPQFGEGETTLGAELELDLVDAQGRPALVNRAVLADSLDPRVTVEIDRFNLEINALPGPLAGQPLSALARDLEGTLAEIGRAAARHGARVVTVGILPTLTEADLQSGALTDGHRYRALSSGLRRLRGGEVFPVNISGEDDLAISCDDVTLEGANTSFQLHLRVAPRDFARVYNAAQIATAPVLAAAGNSPLFLGRRLWQETRVALFRQAIDARPDADEEDWRPARVSFGHGWVREGAAELFAESVALHEPLLPVVGPEDPLACVRAGGVPRLDELRLHQGTVWRWNRAIYDAANGGHLRVEMRALPAGPTVTDMVANAGFLIGLTLALSAELPALLPGFTFGHARRNFYEAARHGLDAELVWADGPGQRVHLVHARELAQKLVPVAERGLIAAGVAPDEAARWLEIIARRIASGQTGAVWQRHAFAQHRQQYSANDAVHRLLEDYLAAVESGRPVHEWPRCACKSLI
jgi:gamma-glutamyl:cysteine ligase YbdK (ATP-grasp superfamily)